MISVCLSISVFQNSKLKKFLQRPDEADWTPKVGHFGFFALPKGQVILKGFFWCLQFLPKKQTKTHRIEY